MAVTKGRSFSILNALPVFSPHAQQCTATVSAEPVRELATAPGELFSVKISHVSSAGGTAGALSVQLDKVPRTARQSSRDSVPHDVERPDSTDAAVYFEGLAGTELVLELECEFESCITVGMPLSESSYLTNEPGLSRRWLKAVARVSSAGATGRVDLNDLVARAELREAPEERLIVAEERPEYHNVRDLGPAPDGQCSSNRESFRACGRGEQSEAENRSPWPYPRLGRGRCSEE